MGYDALCMAADYLAGQLTRCAYSIKSWEQSGLPRATDVALSDGLAFQCPGTLKSRALPRDSARQLFIRSQDVLADTQQKTRQPWTKTLKAPFVC
jgi:hypothetical protein